MADNFYGSIKIDNGIKRIKVNDNGDYIELSINDTSFFDRFADLLRWLEDKQSEMQAFTADQTEKYGENSKDVHHVIDTVKAQNTVFTECMGKIDDLFGADTCTKVFGPGLVPNSTLIGDFFEQLTPLLQKMAEERGNNIKLRYNRNRKGQRTKDQLIADYKNV